VAARVDLLVRAVPDGVGATRPARLEPGEDVGRIAGRGGAVTDLDGRRPGGPSAGRARGADEDLALARIGATHRPNGEQVAGGIHGEDREEHVWRPVGGSDGDKLREVLATVSVVVQEVQRAARVWSTDVHPQSARLASVVGGAAGSLKHLARDLVDGRIAVGAKRRIARAVSRGHACGGVDVVQAVRAHVPLGSPVGARTDDVVPFQVDERTRTDIFRLVGGPGRGIIDGEPLAVRAGAAARAAEEVLLVDGEPLAVRAGAAARAAEEVLLVGGARVGGPGDRHPLAGERP